MVISYTFCLSNMWTFSFASTKPALSFAALSLAEIISCREKTCLYVSTVIAFLQSMHRILVNAQTSCTEWGREQGVGVGVRGRKRWLRKGLKETELLADKCCWVSPQPQRWNQAKWPRYPPHASTYTCVYFIYWSVYNIHVLYHWGRGATTHACLFNNNTNYMYMYTHQIHVQYCKWIMVVLFSGRGNFQRGSCIGVTFWSWKVGSVPIF